MYYSQGSQCWIPSIFHWQQQWCHLLLLSSVSDSVPLKFNCNPHSGWGWNWFSHLTMHCCVNFSCPGVFWGGLTEQSKPICFTKDLLWVQMEMTRSCWHGSTLLHTLCESALKKSYEDYWIWQFEMFHYHTRCSFWHPRPRYVRKQSLKNYRRLCLIRLFWSIFIPTSLLPSIK